jgi:uncharacterized protein
MRRSEFEIKDKELIVDILANVEYGTLALCNDNQPYSVPVNFVYNGGSIYFHGARKGKKKEFILNNPNASLSIVEQYSMIQSYFSSNDELACPATQFFKSIICDGAITVVEDYNEKVQALQLLMEKLQSEGKYKHLSEEVYQKMINATEVFRFDIDKMVGKIKLGQNLSKERFDMVLTHLEKRGNDIDKLTIKQMRDIK